MQLSILGVHQYDGFMAGVREFGELIKNARINRGMTGAELAQQMGRSHSVIVRWERGQPSNAPDPETFWDFSEALGLSPEEMLISLGYLKDTDGGGADSPALSAVRAILEGRDFTDKQIGQLTRQIRGLVEMMEG